MSDRCEFESEIIRTARGGELTDALREHLAGCADCAAALETAPWMRSFAAQPDPPHTVPIAAVIWLKSRIIQQEVAADRAALPLTAAQISAYMAVAACWAAVLNWKWAALQQWFLELTPSRMIAQSSVHSGSSLSISFMVVVFVLASLTVTLAAHTILAEE